jgi:hypothetical protein
MESEQNDPTQHSTAPPPRPSPDGPILGARMPILGNAEWAMWALVEIIFAIVWAASPAVDGGTFVQLTAIVTFAYLISRGIAKAGRVLER